METFSHFTTVFVHREWKRTKLLSQKGEVTSQVPEQFKTRDLWKLGNFKEIHEIIGIGRKVVNLPLKRKILTALLQNCKKSAIEHSIEKPTSLFYVFVYNILSKVVNVNKNEFLLYFKKGKSFRSSKQQCEDHQCCQSCCKWYNQSRANSCERWNTEIA